MLRTSSRTHRICRFIASALICFALNRADAVILFRSGDPTANARDATMVPFTGPWDYEGLWGQFLGAPISPHFFLTAAHVGAAGGGVFIFRDVSYTVLQQFNDPSSDLSLWQVEEAFPVFASLYSLSDEAGKLLIVIGRGTQRGGKVTIGNALHGWAWGPSDNVKRWGENIVTGIVSMPGTDFLYARFEQNGLPQECHLSVGDSGGGVWLQDSGIWKLAGINYTVDGPFYLDANGNGAFDGALFDARGFYVSDGGTPPTYTLITGPDVVATGFYSTRVSSKLAWIHSVIDPVESAAGQSER